MNPKTIIPRERAKRDIEEAIDYYAKEAGAEVAGRFLDAVETAFGLIGRHPAAGSPRFGHELGITGLRSRRLSRYPYLVFYLERESHVDVWRLLHAQRDIPAHMEPRGD